MKQLLQHAATGDECAARDVFRLLWPRLLRTARLALASRADAEDAAQSAIVRVLERSSQYDASRDALTWALVLASYEIKTVRRRRQRLREEPGEALEALVDSSANPEHHLNELRRASLFYDALATLSSADQDVILRSFEENDGERGVTFRKRKQRALPRLREALRRLQSCPFRGCDPCSPSVKAVLTEQ